MATAHLSAYEFYWRDTVGESHFIGILPERREDPKRITSESIMNWGKMSLGKEVDPGALFFVEVRIEKNTGEIIRKDKT